MNKPPTLGNSSDRSGDFAKARREYLDAMQTEADAEHTRLKAEGWTADDFLEALQKLLEKPEEKP